VVKRPSRPWPRHMTTGCATNNLLRVAARPLSRRASHARGEIMLKQLTIGKAVMIQVAPYQSVRAEVQAVYDIADGESPEAARAAAAATVRAALLSEVEPTLETLSTYERADWRQRLGSLDELEPTGARSDPGNHQ